jgi:hypothetical protein
MGWKAVVWGEGGGEEVKGTRGERRGVCRKEMGDGELERGRWSNGVLELIQCFRLVKPILQTPAKRKLYFRFKNH